MLQHGLSEESTGYPINQSLRFRASNSAYLSRTFGTPTDGKKWTFSVWIKKSYISTGGGSPSFNSLIGTSSQAGICFCNLTNWPITGTVANQIAFSDASASMSWQPICRDPSAHEHIVIVYDSTQATDTNRIKCYKNNIQLSTQAVYAWPTLNAVSSAINSAAVHTIAAGAGTGFLDGYLSEINFIDGQALDPSYFGQTDPATGIWVPKKYTGTYGTNGFYLPFNDATSLTTLGYDRSGNGNNWTCNGISVTAGATYDVMKDSPTNGLNEVGNYATLNPLDKGTLAVLTLSNGNLSGSIVSSSWIGSRVGFPMSSGKWYWEITPTSASSHLHGICTGQYNLAGVGQDAYGWGYLQIGTKYNNNSAVAYGAAYTTGDVIGVAFDADNGTLTFYKNNVSQGVAYSGLTSGPYFPAFSLNAGSANSNFGQRPFAFSLPAGFKPLHTGNLI